MGDPTTAPGRVLISEEELRTRVSELGLAIARDHEGDNPVLVGVLKGALVFMADLVRAMPIALTMDFIALSSYGGSTRSSLGAPPRLLKEALTGVLALETELALRVPLPFGLSLLALQRR